MTARSRTLAETLEREHRLSVTLIDYIGKWVAVIDSEVVASGETLDGLLDRAPENATVMRVDDHSGPENPRFAGVFDSYRVSGT